MNWGWRIFTVIVIFLAFILFMVFKAMNQDFHLVADNYYEKEIRYQDEINMINKARALEQPLMIKYNLQEEVVLFVYPKQQVKGISGKLYFYRPSDSRMDKTFEIIPGEDGIQKIGIKSFSKGLWQIKVNWAYGADKFQEEKNIMIQ